MSDLTTRQKNARKVKLSRNKMDMIWQLCYSKEWREAHKELTKKHGGKKVRCHEEAEAFAQVMKMKRVDGHFRGRQHSWLALPTRTIVDVAFDHIGGVVSLGVARSGMDLWLCYFPGKLERKCKPRVGITRPMVVALMAAKKRIEQEAK